MLSKGHASLALYAALHETGVIDSAELASFCVDGSRLGTHPDHVLPGVDFSTGSLGHGLSLATGSALAARLSGSERRTFVLMSDAECNEGSVWEAVMFAAHHRLANLVVVVDVNGQQALGYTRDVIDLAPLDERWRAFGWDAHVVDGHDHAALRGVIDGLGSGDDRPHVLLAQTVFGHGVSYMEREIRWHYLPMDDDQYATRAVRAGRARGTQGRRMRRAFVTALAELADSDPRVLLLTGDLGFMAVEPFAERHPDRFINVGVAEQNMVGMATGLAEAGYVPFVYSIATFAALRSYEFIRNGPVLHDLPVRIVGVGPGLDYGPNGITHWALEDVAVLRPLPGLAVIAPADDPQTASAVAATSDAPGPGLPAPGAHGPGDRRARRSLRAGPRARARRRRRRCAGRAREHGLDRRGDAVACSPRAAWPRASSSSPACAPRPTHDLVAALAGVPLAISVESHYVDGGLGSLTAEVVAENGLATRLVRAGVRRSPAGETGGARVPARSARPLAACARALGARAPRPPARGRCGALHEARRPHSLAARARSSCSAPAASSGANLARALLEHRSDVVATTSRTPAWRLEDLPAANVREFDAARRARTSTACSTRCGRAPSSTASPTARTRSRPTAS